MSDEEDSATLLNEAGRVVAMPVNQAVVESNQCIPPENLRKPVARQQDDLTPLTVGNQMVLVSMVAFLSGMAFGCDIGTAKPIAPLITRKFSLSCFEKEFAINTWLIGALLGSLTGGVMIDSFGRRWTMILSLIFLTFGSLLSAHAGHYILLLIARIICGYSGVVSTVAHCIYMVEVSDSNKRGYTVLLYPLGMATGFLVSVIVAAVKNIDFQWRFSTGITAIPALTACIITIIFLQRSPSFLLFKRISRVVQPMSKPAWKTVFETLAIMVFMLILQQGTGRRHILYYAPRLFTLLGVCSNVAEITTLIALGVVRVFGVVLSILIVERCGRRTALITSATICMMAISSLSLLATIDKPDDNLDFTDPRCKSYPVDNVKLQNLPTGSPPPFPLLPTPLAVIAPSPETQIKTSCETQDVSLEGFSGSLHILAVVALLVYEAAYALGLGPVPLLTLAEVFPAAIRGKCVSFLAIVVWITHIIATESVTKMTRSMTLAGSYLFHSFMCLVTIFYVFLLIPETKGKSLHQIAQELRKTSLSTRMCNNIHSLPLICNLKWIRKYEERSADGQSTLI